MGSPGLSEILLFQSELFQHPLQRPGLQFMGRRLNDCEFESEVQRPVTTMSAGSDPPDLKAALSRQSFDLPDEFAALHVPSVGQICPHDKCEKEKLTRGTAVGYERMLCQAIRSI